MGAFKVFRIYWSPIRWGMICSSNNILVDLHMYNNFENDSWANMAWCKENWN